MRYACLFVGVSVLALTACGGGNNIVTPPPPPSSGIASVTFSPSSAQVSINSNLVTLRSTGEGKVELAGPSGSYILSFVATGYERTSKVVSILSGQATSESVTLSPLPPVVSANALPNTIEAGSGLTSIITVSATFADAGCKILPVGTTVLGNFSVSPSQTTTYSGTCTGIGGTTGWSTTVTVTPPPTLKFKYWSAGGSSLSGLQVKLASGSWSGQYPVQLDGTVSIPLTLPIRNQMSGVVSVVTDAENISARKFFPSDTSLSQNTVFGGQTINVVAVPLSQNFTCGTFAGQSITTSLEKPRKPAGDGAWFYMNMDQGKPWFWQSLTIKLAFDETSLPTFVPISQAGKASALTMLTDMENRLCDLGLRFVPSSLTEVLAQGGITISVDANLPSGLAQAGISIFAPGSTYFKFGFANHANEGMLGTGVLQHEIFHTLGFGHTCAWPSVMSVFCEQVNPPPSFANTSGRPTAEDVAYAKMYYDVRKLEVDKGALIGFASARSGERIHMLGLPRLSSPSVVTQNQPEASLQAGPISSPNLVWLDKKP